MDYQERLERMLANGTINAAEAEGFSHAIKQLPSALATPPAHRRLPLTLIGILTGGALLGGIVMLLNARTQTGPALVQNVSEALNQQGATGDIGGGATGLATIALLVLAPAGAVLALLAKTYNTLAALDEEAHRADAVIQSCLQRRQDLLPGLQSVVKQAMSFEEGLQSSIAEQRSGKAAELSSALHFPLPEGAMIAPKLVVAMEAYPALRSQESVMHLQHQLESIERDLMIARNIRAAAVADFNTQARGVPGSLVAAHAGFLPAGHFSADTAPQKPLS